MTAAPTRDVSRGMNIAIAVLAIAGVAVSSFSLYHHFSKSQSSFCDLGQAFNCDLVNRSQYSNVFGIPVALVGVLGYLTLLALATIYREKAETPVILAIASTLGLCFAVRLAYIEAFVLGAWCILCLSSLALIVTITVLAIANATTLLRRKNQ